MTKKNKSESFTKSLYTTGDIAKYCHTTITQVNRWIQRGEIKSFKIPGGHNRITVEEFKNFIERYDIPISEEIQQKVRKTRILIADDDTTFVDLFSELLKANFTDVEIEVAYDGYEALIKTGDIKPDILILDMRMPKIDGLEVCRRLRQDTTIDQDIIILALTGHSEAYDRNEVLTSGANEYLIKSMDIDNLIEQVKKLL